MPAPDLNALDEEKPASREWLKAVMKPARSGLREAIVVSLFINLLALAVPIFVLQVYTRVVFSNGISTLYGLLIGVLTALLFDFIIRQARSRMLQRVALRIDVSLGRSLYDKISSLPLRTLESRPSGFWQTLFRDAEVVRNTFSGSSAVLLTDLPFAVLFVVVIYIIAPPVVWVLLIALPVFIIVAIISGRMMETATKGERQAGIGRDAFLTELLQGRSTVKALALENAIKPAWEDKHADTIERALVRGGRTDTFSNIGASLTMLTTIALVTAGALAIIDLRLTIGALIASTMLGNRVIGPFNQLVGNWRNYANCRQALKRLDAVFSLAEDRTERSIRLDRPEGRLTLEAVSYGYEEGRPPVIDNLSMEVKPPGILGVVGRNGCGKTTLLKMMQGLYPPTSGRVLLDGGDTSQFSRHDLATWIGYVPQECFLFAGTIRENIAITNPEASDEEIVRAATLAGVHEYVIDLSDGYATEIGEAGSRLSGGQRQRIAIARALLPDPPILLLDEVSGNLDMQAEIALRDTLSELARDHTIVVVTHTPVLLRACNAIMVLERGRIAMGGPTQEILPRLFGGTPRPADATVEAQQNNVAQAATAEKSS
ncbi:MAG: peptidase domain-containing ABC transporter [Proteobacteria bacterium]|nr:peptidase domain-containing ABC transporter [Pseudomonadota bacterium]MDA1355352.1 peptidase domain-containing ABC transporter [Pseudomonadota bacterium]